MNVTTTKSLLQKVIDIIKSYPEFTPYILEFNDDGTIIVKIIDKTYHLSERVDA